MLKTRVAVLTDREYADLIGGLQIARDYLIETGMTGEGVKSVLDKLYAITDPSTNGVSIYPNQAHAA